MRSMRQAGRLGVLLVTVLAGILPGNSGTLRLATYNVENYVDVATESRRPKSAEAKAKVKENILAIKPDVLALEEMGSESALRELQATLKAGGLDLPHAVHVKGWDTNIHVAVLSRFPIVQNRSHTNESFLLNGRRFRVSRGFAELDIRASEKFIFTLFATHLKSKRAVPEADEAELRLEEARLLREKIAARLEASPEARIAVVGDFNDHKDSASTRTIIGRGKGKLIDTRPAERNGDNTPSENPAWEPRNITWTHYYGKEDTYSRIDFILISPALAKAWQTNESKVFATPNWGLASDHRPIVVSFDIP